MLNARFFKRQEFACKCGCGFDTIDAATLAILEDVREHFDVPMIVTSGARCPDHNRRVGGGARSQHLYGRAADIVARGVSPERVAEYVESQHPQASVGRYSTFVHVDTRSGGPARWKG